MQEIKSGKLQVKKIQTSAAQGIGAEGEAYYFGFSDQNGNEDGASLLSTPFVFDSELRDAMNSLEGYAFYLVTSFDDELVETDYMGLYAINKNFEAVYSEGCSDGVRIEKFDSFEALVDEAFYRLFHINANFKPTHLGQGNILDGITKFIYQGVIEGEEAEKFAKLFSAPECREIIQAFLKKNWYDREEWESWARCVGWIGLLKRQPTTWNECPRDILQKTEVVEALKKGWVALLKDDIAAWDQCPVSIRTDAVLVETAIVGWCKGMKKITDCLKQVPEEHLQAVLWKKYPISSYAFSGFSAIVDEPQATLSLVKERWRHSPKSERANAAKALAELRNYPWNFCVLPAEQQSHPLIQEVAAEGWVSRIKENAVFAKHVPELLLTHPKLKSFFAAQEQKEEGQVEEQILAQVKRAPGISDERLDKLGLPEGDKKLAVQIRKLRLKHWEKAIKKDWEAWERMPHSLRHDEGILTTMRETLGPQIRKNSGLWNELPDCYRQDPALQRVHKFATQAQIKCANA